MRYRWLWGQFLSGNPRAGWGRSRKKRSPDKFDLLESGLIESAHSAWSLPVILVRKKDGSWRFCVDYRKLNSVSLQDAYPLPCKNVLAGSKYFSALDLLSGYWQVSLSPDAQEKVAFITRDELWNCKVLSFGLTSARPLFSG